MVVVGVLLGLLKVTGITAHIILSVVGVIVLAVYSVLTKKDWKIPVLEIEGYGKYKLRFVAYAQASADELLRFIDSAIQA